MVRSLLMAGVLFLSTMGDAKDFSPYFDKSVAKPVLDHRRTLNGRIGLIESERWLNGNDEWSCLHEMADDMMTVFVNPFLREHKKMPNVNFHREQTLEWRLAVAGTKYWFKVVNDDNANDFYEVSFRASSGWSRAHQKYQCNLFLDTPRWFYMTDASGERIYERLRGPINIFPAPGIGGGIFK